ncbi:hypothetical protein [Aeromonas enterica]
MYPDEPTFWPVIKPSIFCTIFHRLNRLARSTDICDEQYFATF